MSLWRHEGSKFETVDWHRLYTPGTAVVCGSGYGLKTYKADPANLHICINAAYKTVRPDVWVAMDNPDFFGKQVLSQPFRKILRGNMPFVAIEGRPTHAFPETYFVDIDDGPLSNVFLDRTANPTFVWTKNSFLPAIQLAVWMGYRTIGFAGVNLGGAHCDDREFTTEQKADYVILWKEITASMMTLTELAAQVGIKFVSYTEDSPINTFMEKAV